MPLGSDAPQMPDLPEDGKDAEDRFELYRRKDPFPSIPPALLNSADLLDYIATAGMLSPYDVPTEHWDDWLKPASCAVACTGDVVRFAFDEQTKRHTKVAEYTVGVRQRLVLPANSITFLHLGTTFRIPNYIAARFNLAIREIHRGLLVGTGPLVDPGFVGRLFVPLHNLTSNHYTIKFGEPLVWVEFTKLSPYQAWLGGDEQPRAAGYAPFPDRKLKRTTSDDYLDHANDGNPIASSIPEEVGKAVLVAEAAHQRVDSLRSKVRNWGIAATIVTGIAVVLPMINLVSDTNGRVDSLSSEREKTKAAISDIAAQNADQRKQIAAAVARLERQRTEIDRLKRARAAASGQ